MKSERWEITLLDEQENPMVVFEYDKSAQARTVASNYITAGQNFKVAYHPVESEVKQNG